MASGVPEIQSYEHVLDIRRVIEESRLQDLDQALNICDLSSVERKHSLWQRLLPRIRPYYAVKCNDDPVVVQLLADLGTGFDCASKNELKLVGELIGSSLDSRVVNRRTEVASSISLISSFIYLLEAKQTAGDYLTDLIFSIQANINYTDQQDLCK